MGHQSLLIFDEKLNTSEMYLVWMINNCKINNVFRNLLIISATEDKKYKWQILKWIKTTIAI